MVATGKSHVDCCNWKGFGKREGDEWERGVGERGIKREEGISGRKKGRMREENLERKKGR